MARVTSSVARRKRHKKVLKQAKGYYGARSRLFRTAKEAVDRAMLYSYRDRRQRKRMMRRLWITRINAAARLNGTTYSALIAACKAKDVMINRKMLSDIAISEPAAFSQIVTTVMGKV